MLEIKQA